jgi:hypothetical protein
VHATVVGVLYSYQLRAEKYPRESTLIGIMAVLWYVGVRRIAFLSSF